MISFGRFGRNGQNPDGGSEVAANPSAEANVRARSQQRLLAYVAIGAVVIGGAYAVFKDDGSDGKKSAVEDVLDRVNVSDTVNRNLSQKEWLASSEADIAQMKNKIREIERGRNVSEDVEGRLEALEKENAALKRDGQKVLAAYEQENARLKKQAAHAAKAPPSGKAAGPAGQWKGEEPFRPASGAGAGRQGAGGGFPTGFGEVKTISFGATAKGGSGAPLGFNATAPDAPPTTIEASEDYLPPNSYAPARVIVGVDASVGVQSQTDPLPVLLRITGPARSVINNGKLLTTKLEGCVINGAARGDLSSEKVYVKLVRMTCDQPGGRVAVSEVKGYISFGGKAGVRGNVVSREGGLVMQALLAGIAGGFGRGFQANADSMLRNPTVSINGEKPQLSTGDIVRGGLGEGMSTAGDMVSSYLIERAEQYQPIVEMPTGVDVEIVFLDGVYVRGSKS